MEVIMYGSHLCQDVLFAVYKLKEQGVQIDFRNISVDFSALKEFMNFRENYEIFTEIKQNNKLGIPFFVLNDGNYTFDFNEIIEKI